MTKFIGYSGKSALASVRVPTLAVMGGKDQQTPVTISKPQLERAFSGRRHLLQTKLYLNLDHALRDPGDPFITIDPRVPEEIADFVLAQDQ